MSRFYITKYPKKYNLFFILLLTSLKHSVFIDMLQSRLGSKGPLLRLGNSLHIKIFSIISAKFENTTNI